jgi:hypothetical protein
MDEERRVPTSNIYERITSFSSLVIAISGVVALIIAGLHIHELREEARVLHLTEFVREFDNPPFSSVRKNLALKRIDKVEERLRPLDLEDPPGELYDALDFCVDIGLLTERGYLNRHDVWSEFGYWLFVIYADARPLLDAEQKKGPAAFTECSKLVESIRPIEIREDAGALEHPSESDIYDEYSSEIESESSQPVHGGRRSKKP